MYLKVFSLIFYMEFLTLYVLWIFVYSCVEIAHNKVFHVLLWLIITMSFKWNAFMSVTKLTRSYRMYEHSLDTKIFKQMWKMKYALQKSWSLYLLWAIHRSDHAITALLFNNRTEVHIHSFARCIEITDNRSFLLYKSRIDFKNEMSRPYVKVVPSAEGQIQ